MPPLTGVCCDVVDEDDGAHCRCGVPTGNDEDCALRPCAASGGVVGGHAARHGDPVKFSMDTPAPTTRRTRRTHTPDHTQANESNNAAAIAAVTTHVTRRNRTRACGHAPCGLDGEFSWGFFLRRRAGPPTPIENSMFMARGLNSSPPSSDRGESMNATPATASTARAKSLDH
jgi:hypothetical protein